LFAPEDRVSDSSWPILLRAALTSVIDLYSPSASGQLMNFASVDSLLVRVLGTSLQEATVRLVVIALALAAIGAFVIWLV
jgi:hypothetical protein